MTSWPWKEETFGPQPGPTKVRSMPASSTPLGALPSRPTTPFAVDHDGAHKGYLYVDVDRVGTVVIHRAADGICVDIYGFESVAEHPLAALQVTDRVLHAARARHRREKRT